MTNPRVMEQREVSQLIRRSFAIAWLSTEDAELADAVPWDPEPLVLDLMQVMAAWTQISHALLKFGSQHAGMPASDVLQSVMLTLAESDESP